jgi:hypothetical protein
MVQCFPSKCEALSSISSPRGIEKGGGLERGKKEERENLE